MFHFHRLDCHQRRTARHSLSGLDMYRHDRARQRRDQRTLLGARGDLQRVLGPLQLQNGVAALSKHVQQRIGLDQVQQLHAAIALRAQKISAALQYTHGILIAGRSRRIEVRALEFDQDPLPRE